MILYFLLNLTRDLNLLGHDKIIVIAEVAFSGSGIVVRCLCQFCFDLIIAVDHVLLGVVNDPHGTPSKHSSLLKQLDHVIHSLDNVENIHLFVDALFTTKEKAAQLLPLTPSGQF